MDKRQSKGMGLARDEIADQGGDCILAKEHDSGDDGIVYALTNPCMPGLVKIGLTKRSEVEQRMKELYGTGVPLPFECPIAVVVRDPAKAEAALHRAFAPHRINEKREFFEIDIACVRPILDYIGKGDATPFVEAAENKVVDIVSKAAAIAHRKRRPPLNFDEMQIPIGAVLVFTKTPEEAGVVGAKKVLFREIETSLTAATKVALGISYDVDPTNYWTYEGRSHATIYDETYPVS